MNRFLELDEENMTLTLEPGVLLMEISKYVEERGLFYPPDPGEKTATIGGNINTNAGGMRAVKYGRDPRLRARARSRAGRRQHRRARRQSRQKQFRLQSEGSDRRLRRNARHRDEGDPAAAAAAALQDQSARAVPGPAVGDPDGSGGHPRQFGADRGRIHGARGDSRGGGVPRPPSFRTTVRMRICC